MTRLKRQPVLIAAGFAAFLAAACVLIGMEYSSYQEKMQIIVYMAAGEAPERGSLAAASGILKGIVPQGAEEARGILEEYGYLNGRGDVYFKAMQKNCLITAGLCIAGFFLYCAALWLMQRSGSAHRSESLELVRQELIQMKEDRFRKENAWAGDKGRKAVRTADESMSRLQMELESLAAYLDVVRRQAEKDREGTKSLVTDISHQLKNPTAALKISFEVLENQELTEAEKEEFLNRCGEQIERLEELVAALVNISRMETGMITIQRKQAVIFDTVVIAVNRIYPQACAKQMEVVLEAEEELKGIMLLHDPKWLSEAIISVLENAVKYSGTGTVITVRIVKMTVFLRIEIEDMGIGIPKEEWNRIFQRFYRGKAAQASGEQGSGVGLYLAREIVERHHGTLTAAQPHGARWGSRFVFQLPLKE